MDITISGKILSGNMGDGWTNQNDAADGYAEYVTQRIRAEVQPMYPDATINVDFSAHYNTSGCSGGISVDVDGDDPDVAYDVMRDLEDYLLHYRNEIWNDWCGGAGSDYFSEE